MIFLITGKHYEKKPHYKNNGCNEEQKEAYSRHLLSDSSFTEPNITVLLSVSTS